jgi:hypothetical protein
MSRLHPSHVTCEKTALCETKNGLEERWCRTRLGVAALVDFLRATQVLRKCEPI